MSTVHLDDFANGPREVAVNLNAPTMALMYYAAFPEVAAELARRKGETKAFNPEEARDRRGRWTRVGAEVSKIVKELTSRGRREGTGSADDPIDVGGDLDRAARLLGEGKHIRLNSTVEVGTFVDRLGIIARDMAAKGEKAPNFDLCKVSVPGTNLFCQQSKGIPRVRMPQLGGHAVPGSMAAGHKPDVRGNVDMGKEFVKELRSTGVSVTHTSMPASHLKATQDQLNGTQVAGLVAAIRDGTYHDSPIFVTRDGYVLDGHHRWAAKVAVDTTDNHLGDVPMNVDVIDLDIGAALTFANDFMRRVGIEPLAFAGKNLWDALERFADTYLPVKAFDPAEHRDERGRWTAGAVSIPHVHLGMAKRLVEQARAGGFTFSAVSGDVPTTGLAVSPYPDREHVVSSDDLRASTITDYAKANADLLSQPGHYIGGWRDGDKIYLDVAVVAPDEQAATTISERFNQEAFFNLATGEVVNVNPGAAAARQAASGAGSAKSDRGGGTVDGRRLAERLAGQAKGLAPDEAKAFNPGQPRDSAGRWVRTVSALERAHEHLAEYLANRRVVQSPGVIDRDDPNQDMAFGDRLGLCYELAAQYLVGADDEGATLVHGTIQGDGNPPLDHAWVVRSDGLVFEPTSGHVMPQAEFDAYYHPVTKETYTAMEARLQMLRAMHYGPWGDRPTKSIKRDVSSELRDVIGRWTRGGAPGLPLSTRQAQERAPLSTPERTAAANATLLADPTDMAALPKDVQRKLVAHVKKIFKVTPEQMRANLAAVYDRAGPKIREQGSTWYAHAGTEAGRVAADTGFTREQVAGAIAATSPQQEWGGNLSEAEYVAHAVRQDWPLDAATLDALDKHVKAKKLRGGGVESHSLLKWAQAEVMKTKEDWPATLEGRLSGQTPIVRAALTKAMAQAGLHTRDGRALSYTDDVTGKRTLVSFSSGLGAMVKAMSILGGQASGDVINGHKVRSFYNNIILGEANPYPDVTIDTHALSAAVGKAIPASDKRIATGFGTPKVTALGLAGTYPVFADAYRQVAAQYGLVPEQIQAIIWLQWREEHP